MRRQRRIINGLLLLDKPIGASSNAALQRAKWLFNAAKAGHTGTLDPLATGLLLLCFGKATKLAATFLDSDKTYRATVRLGVTTETADAEGSVLKTRPVDVSRAQIEVVLTHFTGEIEQIPPMYSALKREGRPLYEYARKGIELERQPRQVTIHDLSLLSCEENQFEIEITCSKGTYIRTLAADIGESLGCGAHLAALRRTHIGQFDVADAHSLDELALMDETSRDKTLIPLICK